VRGHLEDHAGPLQHVVHDVERGRKQLIMARENQIRKVAYTQGIALDSADKRDERRHKRRGQWLTVMQRVSVLESLHHRNIEERRAARGLSHHDAAVRLQRVWRGRDARQRTKRRLVLRIRAAMLIQRFVRRWRERRARMERELELLALGGMAEAVEAPVGAPPPQ